MHRGGQVTAPCAAQQCAHQVPIRFDIWLSRRLGSKANLVTAGHLKHLFPLLSCSRIYGARVSQVTAAQFNHATIQSLVWVSVAPENQLGQLTWSAALTHICTQLVAYRLVAYWRYHQGLHGDLTLGHKAQNTYQKNKDLCPGNERESEAQHLVGTLGAAMAELPHRGHAYPHQAPAGLCQHQERAHAGSHPQAQVPAPAEPPAGACCYCPSPLFATLLLPFATNTCVNQSNTCVISATACAGASEHQFWSCW